ncbi:MAG: thiamine pyrophosphate-dependent enzyme [Candidatus Methanomethyliaceae archaeon]
MSKNLSVSYFVQKYFYESQFPTMWCPGCGNGTVAMAMVRAVEKAGLDFDKTIHVAGIGCACVAHWYTRFTALQTAHGRALPSATGIKLANPELNVIVTMGDGDCVAIGGNHLIHACRRNIDLTAIVYNNFNYGMTGGQVGPTTPKGALTATSPFGNIEIPFDICRLAEAAGATFVARGCVYYVRELIDLIEKGIKHKGFSLIEVITPCPVAFGRRNKISRPAEMWKLQKEFTVSVEKARKMSEEELAGKLLRGVLVEKQRPEYTEEYMKLVNQVRGENAHA